MAVTTYAGWVADGKPAYEAQPIADMLDMFKSHGYTVYWYPDQRHLEANPPEDHTPYSHTPWPGAQPYPLCLALDLMPKDGDARSLTAIARQIIADKDAGRAPWIKYINWTDENGKVWHTKWQPSKVTTSSSDSGHVHLSIRTDWADPAQAAAAGHNIYAAQGWDPINGTEGDENMGYPTNSEIVSLIMEGRDRYGYVGAAGYHNPNTGDEANGNGATYTAAATGGLKSGLKLTDAQVNAIASQVSAAVIASLGDHAGATPAQVEAAVTKVLEQARFVVPAA